MTTVNEPDYQKLLDHFDILAPIDADTKWKIFEYGREQCPIARTDANGSFWLITRYDDVRHVLEDWQTYSSLGAPIYPTSMRLCPFDYDPPIQVAARKLLNPLFSRSALAPCMPRMRELAAELINGWIDKGRTELVDEFADPYVSRILIELVFNDMSEDDLNFARDIAHRGGHDGDHDQVYADLFTIAEKYLENARRTGVTRDGVVKSLLTGEFDGRPVNEEEQIGVLAILILGGLDTTRGAITSIAYRLAENPGLEDRLRDPRWVRRDLDEFLRLDSPVAALARVATRNTELNGVAIKAGDRIQIRYDSANRDDSKFHDADALIFDEQRTGHAAFGFGIHRCLGSNLARMQIEIAFDELLKRIKNLRMSEGFAPNWLPGASNALESLELDFDKIGK
jgi:cytochrome P450